MEWLQILSLFLANAGLVVWMRTESRNDWRHMDNKLDSFRAETTQMIKAIHDEMKDFHDRLFKLEQDKK